MQPIRRMSCNTIVLACWILQSCVANEPHGSDTDNRSDMDSLLSQPLPRASLRGYDKRAKSMEVGTSSTAANTSTSETVAWDYKAFAIGDWPEKGFPLCAGMPNALFPDGRPALHNEFQSPIDINPANATSVDEFPTFAAIDGGCKRANVYTDDHSVYGSFEKVNCSNLKMSWKGKDFILSQFHFHSLSENKYRGRHQEGEVHLVHQAEDGQVLVLGVFLDENNATEAGSRHALLNWMFNQTHLTADGKDFDEDQARESVGENSPVQFSINPYPALVRKGDRFLSFLGSLTTPPCTPNVEWIMMEEPVKFSTKMFLELRSFLQQATQADSYYHDYRPAQALNGRTIYQGIVGSVPISGLEADNAF